MASIMAVNSTMIAIDGMDIDSTAMAGTIDFIEAKLPASPQPRNHNLAQHPYHQFTTGNQLDHARCGRGIHHPSPVVAAMVGVVGCRLSTIGRKYKFLCTFYIGTIVSSFL